MNKILIVFGVIYSIIRLIPEIMQLVESPGFGAEKKEAVLQIVGIVYDELVKVIPVVISKERILAISDNVIEIFVKLYNLVGFFRHQEPTN